MNSLPATAAAPVAGASAVPKHLRRLRANELVSHGDFIADGLSGFQPWEGPGGFRADAFVKPIYRKQASQPLGTKKSH